MNFIGTITWLLFGGIILALFWAIAGLLGCLTIIGIPFGVAALQTGHAGPSAFRSQNQEQARPIIAAGLTKNGEDFALSVYLQRISVYILITVNNPALKAYQSLHGAFRVKAYPEGGIPPRTFQR